ncbi:S8 family serine peptidase [Dyella sp. ASV21]|uniref:S8 family serine peptidase n=1 Tax=Dyella sp. ASV21 TaxID=2795114 RepID=UPI0018ECD197|nr:S8 family serine peptidase [Dyella sp. ASV21]
MKNALKVQGLAVALMLALTAEAAAVEFGTSPPPSPNFDVSALQTNQTYTGFIITYKDGSAERSHASVAVQNVGVAVSRARLMTANRATSRAISVRYGRKLATGADLVETDRALSSSEAATLIRQIAADPAVAFVEPEYMLQAVSDIEQEPEPEPAGAAAFTAPNDDYYGGYQWDYLAANGAGFYDSTQRIDIPNWGGTHTQDAWRLADGAGITIASLDTGVTNHPDLNLSMVDAGYDFITAASTSGRATNGRVPGAWDTGDWVVAGQCSGKAAANSSWHGTHVFGTAGGQVTNNGVGLAGTAFGARVVPVRVLGHCGGSNADIADAITWASGGPVAGVPANANPAQVISLSLGGKGTCAATSTLATAITGAIGRGATVLVAAGNDNADVVNYSPANCPGAVVVASTGTTGARSYYSNYGALVTVAAPGGGVYKNDAASGTQVNTGFIWSAGNTGKTVPVAGTYNGKAGTSQATPHVAGVVALMQSYRLSQGKGLLTPAQVASLLKSTASVPHVAPSVGAPIGAGIVHAYAAVQAAGAQP